MLDTGTYGAKVQSWKSANPRDLLRQIIEENRNADKPALLAITRDRLLAGDAVDHLEAVIEYWFANNYHSLVERPAPPPREATKATRAAAVKNVKEKVKTRILEEAQAMLLDIVTLPNGKSLRDSTGKDCAKAGGWLSKLAEKVGPKQRVGATLSEEEVRSVWKASA
jgi:hypothetical protein